MGIELGGVFDTGEEEFGGEAGTDFADDGAGGGGVGEGGSEWCLLAEAEDDDEVSGDELGFVGAGALERGG
jgi:hypothetical protein